MSLVIAGSPQKVYEFFFFPAEKLTIFWFKFGPRKLSRWSLASLASLASLVACVAVRWRAPKNFRRWLTKHGGTQWGSSQRPQTKAGEQYVNKMLFLKMFYYFNVFIVRVRMIYTFVLFFFFRCLVAAWIDAWSMAFEQVAIGWSSAWRVEGQLGATGQLLPLLLAQQRAPGKDGGIRMVSWKQYETWWFPSKKS